VINGDPRGEVLIISNIFETTIEERTYSERYVENVKSLHTQLGHRVHVEQNVTSDVSEYKNAPNDRIPSSVLLNKNSG